MLACGGAGNQLSLWDLSSEGSIQRRFADRVSDKSAQLNEPEEEAGAESGTKEQDFEAMMSAGDAVAEKVKGSKKKGGKGKKKAHRRGR